jgi:polyhydroxyalkanoate depolymerase
MVAPWRVAAGLTSMTLDHLPPVLADLPIVRRQKALCDLIARTTVNHVRPRFGIDRVDVGSGSVGVREESVVTTPFATLLHFAKDQAREEPRVLVVAALAGHFATLMRDTVRTLLSDHDVYLAEWHNARDVPVREGRFGFDEYVEHLVRFLEELGPGTHVVAVCQPCPATIAATSLLAARRSSVVPRTLTLMAGPVDTSSHPTLVNQLATTLPLVWFEHNVVTTVPAGYPGFGRRVYPGFLQLAGFVSMNLGRHIDEHWLLYESLAHRDEATATAIGSFYDAYFAVLDMPAEFYLDTIDAVFQRNLLARGELTWRGTPIDPSVIRSTALLTVEGERDDVCGLGQTFAAHELLSGLGRSQKRHHLQAGVGHYGVFSGRRWQQETYPVVRDWIRRHA